MREQVVIKEKIYELVSDYKENKTLRDSFFALAEKSFGIDFKEWYEAGYWQDGYKPYSLLFEGQMVANVSVSIADFMLEGQRKHWIQIGCVVVEKAYRNEGLARFLIQYVMKQYEAASECIFLFGNDRVLDFYPKFGFYQVDEYQYSKEVINERSLIKSRVGTQDSPAGSTHYRKEEQLERNYHCRKLDHRNEEDVRLVAHKTSEYYREELLAAFNNTNLVMFYWEDFLSESLYYIEALDTVVVVKNRGDVLQIDEVFGEAELNEVITALIKDNIKTVVLGFVPDARNEYTVSSYHAEDTTLFMNNKELKTLFEKEKLMFPILSHT